MSLPWFRLYSELLNDPKVQMMSEVNRWRFIGLMCIHSRNVSETLHETLHETEIAFQLRISLEDWMETKQVFIEKKFIDPSNKLLNWDKRQFVSDSSTARVQRHREAKKGTQVKTKENMKRFRNVTVTPPDTDTDTDIKEIIPNGITKKKTTAPENFVVTDRHRELAKKNNWTNPEDEIDGFLDHHIAKGSKFFDWDRAFYTWLRENKNRRKNRGDPIINQAKQEEIKQLYREILQPLPNSLPLNQWTKDDEKCLQDRVDQNPKLNWRLFFEGLKNLKRLTGEEKMSNGQRFSLSLSYIVNENAFAKICNGMWDNR